MECPRNVTVCTDSGPYDMVRQVVLPTHTRRLPSHRFPFQKISVRMQDLENAAVQSSYFRTRVCTVCQCGCASARAYAK